MNDAEFKPSFEFLNPPGGQTCPFLFNSPHSGRHYPASLLSATGLDIMTLRRSEDTFVDELFQNCVTHGASLMRAHFPRAFIDLNREPYELDPRMFRGRLPDYANTRSMRVAGGLGTIARIVSDGAEIYQDRLPVTDALERIDTYYKPYHRALVDRLEGMRKQFGCVVLIDCHSMPSARMVNEARARPDFVLGDRYGTSCSPEITGFLHDALEQLGYSVARNKPYAGGFITERYGNPSGAVHAIQIEINRALYLDEISYARSGSFAWLVADLNRVMKQLTKLRFDQTPQSPAEAAE